VGALGGASGGALSSQLNDLAKQLPGGLPPGATQAGGLSALGPMAGLAQTQMTQLLQTIQKGVREVQLTISWKEGKRTESIDFVTDVFSLRQGSDRNGTPGVPLSGAAAGVPGTPGLPGLPGAVGPGQLGSQIPNSFPGAGTQGPAFPQGPIRP
jgi:hypothetical protein